MSVQVLLYGKLLGIEEFLLSDVPAGGGGRDPAQESRILAGRSHWVSLV